MAKIIVFPAGRVKLGLEVMQGLKMIDKRKMLIAKAQDFIQPRPFFVLLGEPRQWCQS